MTSMTGNKGIVTAPSFEEIVTHHHSFTWDGSNGGGYWFDCDSNGRLLNDEDGKRQENFDILMVTKGLTYDGQVTMSRTVFNRGSIKCFCNTQVDLYDAMTNGCGKCGRDYDGNGNVLAHRSQWGMETGESINEVANS